MPLTPQTLCFVTRENGHAQHQVLLGRKLLGFGQGKIVGLGGNVEDGESASECAIREVRKESGVMLDPATLRRSATVTFRFPARPSFDAEVAVFLADRWTGTPTESDEVRPMWFAADNLPLDQMWDDARYWQPQVFAGEHIIATFTFDQSCTKVSQAEVDPQV